MKKVIDYYLYNDEHTKLWKLKLFFSDTEFLGDDEDNYMIEVYDTHCYCMFNGIKCAERIIDGWLHLGLVHFNEYDGFTDDHIQKNGCRL